MPEISRFFGIVIRMLFAERDAAHFHALYDDDHVVVRIDRLAVLSGELPPRALGMVLEWAALHRDELLADWSLLRRALPPRPIAPLR